MHERTQPELHALGFRARAKDVVENPFLRQSFRGAMDFLITKRAAQFPDRKNWKACARWASRSASTTWASCPTCSNSSKPT
jgi:L-lactate dehydrogenase complex protein LldF